MLKQLRKEIYAGKRMPNEHLVEKKLADTYNVTRMTIRQALSILANDGLVEIEPYKGASVAALTIDRIVEGYQVVSMLEGHAAYLAVEHITKEDIKKLKDIVNMQGNVEEGDAKTWQLLNQKFHKIINQRCGNESIIQMIRQHAQFTNHWFLVYANPSFDRDVRAHEIILQALVERNGEKARINMEKHITAVVERMVEHIQKNVPIGMFRSV
ncbi:MAG: GntR family transcriptional regulator [Proteobacteria bacterium]|nr:GntR family transcriptional regulator [Pseudomonadota bacterium]MBU1451340.1 GntR family transcriptional regulator [Pseudomonadota bacterium]MBU2469539.1 GntR family transcriptional regulator [Pseudomonadota bacterium]MBU2518397.1 GntR family transcriptional regulator [Pseudomonadota bacterium]